MSSTVGQKIGEVIVTFLWPIVWVIYVLVGVVVFVETAAVYLSWGVVSRLDRMRRKAGPQAAG